MVGSEENLQTATAYFQQVSMDPEADGDMLQEAYCILTKAARLEADFVQFMKYAMKAVVSGGCSEICLELGLFYEQLGDWDEAIIWYYNAAYEAQPVLVKISGEKQPIEGLLRCYQALGMKEQEEHYRNELGRLSIEK